MLHNSPTFANVAEYDNARMMHDTNNAAVKQYLADNKTNAIPCEVSKSFPYAEQVTNDIKTMIEVWEFMHDAPQKEFVYVSEENKAITTWTGAKLGSVYFGYSYRTNFGDVRVPITVTGINGAKYYGTYFKRAGGYARIAPFKNQPGKC